MTFGEKLQLLRKQNGLSQEQLASQLTVSRQAISKWELDTSLPDTENIIQISNILDVSIDYLLKEDAEQGNESTPPNQNHTAIANKSLTSKIMMLVGGVGILVFWILSSVFPAVTSYAEAGSDTAIVKYGLPAFLEIHNMKLLFILCCITFIAGLIMFFYPIIKSKIQRTK